MKLCDSHIHSICSMDGHDTMLDMALSSYKKGVERVCFTDHVDLDDFRTGEPDLDCFTNKEKMIDMYKETVNNIPSDMEIYLGIELGEGNHNPELAKEIAATKEFDFVIGSLHNLRGTCDFYEMHYPNNDYCVDILDRYVDELIEQSKMDFFDIMAHIGYPVRYILRDGRAGRVNMKTHADKLDVIMKNLIENGKGLEINCSGFRNPDFMEPIPSVDILKRYRELGGEIITVGTDAHKTSQVATGLKEGYNILRDIGYKYFTVYEKRQPIFMKL